MVYACLSLLCGRRYSVLRFFWEKQQSVPVDNRGGRTDNADVVFEVATHVAYNRVRGICWCWHIRRGETVVMSCFLLDIEELIGSDPLDDEDNEDDN